VEALRSRRLPLVYIVFEGEQHGFRMAGNIKRSLEGKLDFYSKVFGFIPGDELEPVHIENLE
jgi:dipeptidyl aminopeptidase/acylaminoacyl peptidase